MLFVAWPFFARVPGVHPPTIGAPVVPLTPVGAVVAIIPGKTHPSLGRTSLGVTKGRRGSIVVIRVAIRGGSDRGVSSLPLKRITHSLA